MNSDFRKMLINMAIKAKERIAPLEGYFVDYENKSFFVVLANRPPKVFAGDKPLDMDVVMEIKK